MWVEVRITFAQSFLKISPFLLGLNIIVQWRLGPNVELGLGAFDVTCIWSGCRV